MICASHETPSWKRLRLAAARMLAVPSHQSGDIDGQEAGTADSAAGRKDQQ